MPTYLALIHKEADSDFGVSFPDLPGCVTAGKTLDEARVFAEEALSLHLDGLSQDGEAAPPPSDLETIMSSRTNQDGVAMLVTSRGHDPRTVRVNITMPEDVLARIDSFAAAQGTTRSGFLVHAAQHEMGLKRERSALKPPRRRRS